MRLSFRLSKEREAIWLRLKERHDGRSDAWIFEELLRQEDYRLQGNTKDDRLNEIKALLLEILDILRGNHDTDHA